MATQVSGGVPVGFYGPPPFVYQFQYQAYARPVAFPKQTDTLTINAREINADFALFAVRVQAFTPPATALVSITEIEAGDSLTSIWESS